MQQHENLCGAKRCLFRPAVFAHLLSSYFLGQDLTFVCFTHPYNSSSCDWNVLVEFVKNENSGRSISLQYGPSKGLVTSGGRGSGTPGVGTLLLPKLGTFFGSLMSP